MDKYINKAMIMITVIDKAHLKFKRQRPSDCIKLNKIQP